MAIKRFIFGTDSHGDMLCRDTANAFLAHMEELQPHYRIHGGDVWDFRPLRTGAGADERTESMTADMKAGLAFIKEMRPTHILRGNHDERLWDKAHCSSNGPLRDLCAMLADQIELNDDWRRAHVLPYDVRHGLLNLHGLGFCHGYYAGMYSPKQHIQLYKDEVSGVIFGHVHRFGQHDDMALGRATGMACGALGQVDMPYNAKTPAKLAHQNGWLYGEIHVAKSGKSEWEAWPVRRTASGDFLKP